LLDYIIIGQGIAGTMLAHALTNIGKKVLVVDNAKENSSSRVAAGIINPITGRRFALSWRINEMLPFAVKTYERLTKKLGHPYFNTIDISRILLGAEEQNNWQTRLGDETYEPFVKSASENRVLFTKSGYLDIALLLSSSKAYFESLNTYVQEEWSMGETQIHENSVTWKGYEAKAIISCEGFESSNNPFFEWLPIKGAKGEALIIECKKLPEDVITKKKIALLPIGNNKFWLGATFDWKDLTYEPTKKGKQELIEGFEKICNLPYKILDHLASVRPTTVDRRPIIGLHPNCHQMGIFGGLGSKGCLLAPYFANQFAENLCNNVAIEKEVDINRFYKLHCKI